MLYSSGSQTPAAAGLWHYSTQLDQTKEASQSAVNIGMAYVATSGAWSIAPNDADGDGIPDYIENALGDGLRNNPGETDWMFDPYPTTGVHEYDSPVYDATDLDGDGMTGADERFLGTNPLLADNPLLVQGFGGGLISGAVQVSVGVQSAVLGQAEGVSLLTTFLGGGEWALRPSPGSDYLQIANGSSTINWDSSYEQNGLHAVCLAISHGPERPIYGPWRAITSVNSVTFPDAFDGFGAGLGIKAVAGASANYLIKFYDATGAPITYNNGGTPQQFSVQGTADQDGLIDTSWDLGLPDGTSFSGDSVRGDFYLSSAAPPADPNSCPGFGNPPGACGSKVWKKEPSWSDGRFIIARVEECPSSKDALINALAADVVDTVGDYDLMNNYYDLGPQGYTQFVPDWNGTVWPGTVDTVFTLNANSRQIFLDALADPSARNFFWVGHSSGWGMGFSVSRQLYAGCPGMMNRYTRVKSEEIRNRLQNDTRRFFRHPYRLVFIDGCCAATGDLCTAFGIPAEKSYVTDYGKRGCPARAFVGATLMNSSSEVNDSDQAHQNSYSTVVFFNHWMAGHPLSLCLQRAQEEFSGSDPLDGGIDTPSGKHRNPLDESFTSLGAQDLTR